MPSELILLTQGRPDEDSRGLVRALLQAAPRGAPLADDLHLTRTPWRHAVRAASLVVGPVDRLRARSRRLDQAAVSWGRPYWADAVEVGRAGQQLRYAPPEALRR